ncbi:hypothetical protein [Vibrio sp. D431a]|uniref:hypothetical protein n=1 Tax=Vibrio sp. D431a TaxID=2837388 RepID=UPI002553EA2D|nr:hypothetical protein [Vibrio sp. D431a]MDK9790072.1 hypothetical protein [Vibrio sp. D431a]
MKKIIRIIESIFLSKDAIAVAKSFNDSKVEGAQVTGRGTIVCPAQSIINSPEFKALKSNTTKALNRGIKCQQ